MRPYRTIKFVEGPDKQDLAQDGRSRDFDRPVFRNPKHKKEVRRYLKHVDKQRTAKLDFYN
ncbi:MAG: hypothetical protein ACRYGG_05090 [Janthinobacterium lividum]